jgi:hypothetical protein
MNVEPRNIDANASPSPESRGLDFYRSDRSLKALLGLYLAPTELAHMEPHFERLGRLVGGRLDDLAREADKTPPRLEQRNRQGEDRQTIVTAPAYREMAGIAFGELALAAVSHRPALGWDRPLASAAKYALTYLFAQSEFGLLCPVNMTDSLTRTIRRFAAPELPRGRETTGCSTATSGSAPMPTRIWLWCWRGRMARRRARQASVCS